MKVRMRLLQPLRLRGHQLPAGAIVAFGFDVARHLHHLRRAVPADPVDLAQLQAAPATIQR